jgi:S1-C subfamily serine protease
MRSEGPSAISVVVIVVTLLVSSAFAGGAIAESPSRTTDVTGGDAVGAALQQQATCDFDSTFGEAITSVVTVRVFGPRGDRALGSGWVYEVDGSDALIVTNQHVVGGALGADVRFSEGQWRSAGQLVGIDPYADLAVLRVSNVPDYVEPLPVSESSPEEGDEVAALGSPLGLEGTITTGIVSAVDRSVTVATERDLYTVVDAIQIDTAISPGNSGGPLVNCAGDVVGVNFAGVSPLAGQNINFAISASMVRRIVPELVESGQYNHSYLGIRAVSLSPTLARINAIDETTQGVMVTSVVAGGPAEGILRGSPSTERLTSLPVGGDVIVAVDGTPIGDEDDLRDYLFENTRPGDTVTATVLRGGEQIQVELSVVARPLPRERAGVERSSI